jgi:hypothetical protein
LAGVGQFQREDEDGVWIVSFALRLVSLCHAGFTAM